MKPFISQIFKNWQITLAIILTLATFILGAYFKHSKTDIIRDATLAAIGSLSLTTLAKIIAYQQKIEDNELVISKFLSLLGSTTTIKETVNHMYDLNKKNDHYLGTIMNFLHSEYNGYLQQLSIGDYNCDVENESKLTHKILACCKKGIKAISYDEVDKWWLTPAGDSYLNVHGTYLKAGKKSIRIFIVKGNEEELLKAILDKHVKIGIETYVVEENYIPDKNKLDLVIYDDYLARIGTTNNKYLGTTALFTTTAQNVDVYKVKFEEVLGIAKNKGKRITV